MIKTLRNHQTGFTIVELLVVIIVIAILAVIGYVMYGGAQDKAREAVLRSDLVRAAELLNVDKTRSGSFPEDEGDSDRGRGLPASTDTLYQYTANNAANPKTFCLTGTNGMVAFYITEQGVVQEGVCTGHSEPVAGGVESGGEVIVADGVKIQEITNENCLTSRVRAVDARDNRTYWVQKLADNKCWMLTNLAYAGGGTNDFGDTRVLQNGTSDTGASYTVAKYYIPTSASPTIEPTSPTLSTDGGATNPQYGYLYNWCGAMGGQLTSACTTDSSGNGTEVNLDISICPSGWRLPTGRGFAGSPAGEFAALVTAIGAEGSSAGETVWMAQRSGYRSNTTFTSQGSAGYYWSSTWPSAYEISPLVSYSNYSWGMVTTNLLSKQAAAAVRCIAA